jgi:hypothetical protein
VRLGLHERRLNISSAGNQGNGDDQYEAADSKE